MIVMREDATPEDVSEVVSRVESTGARAHVIEGAAQQVIGVIGDVELVRDLALEVAPGVDHTMPISRPFKLASSQVTHGKRTVIDIAGRKIGGDHFATIAGPCTVESRDVMLESAHAVKAARRPAASRRRLQAAHLAVQLPGSRRGGPEAAGRGQARHRHAHRHRGHGRP